MPDPLQFRADIMHNRNNAALLARWKDIGLADAWLVAGCLFQTVWNVVSGETPEYGIKDYDIFYFDAGDLSAETEATVQARVTRLFSDLPVAIEVCNQALVHCWYASYFGFPYPALRDARDGIDRFLISGTCVGINPEAVYAPNGLDHLYQGWLAMNPLTPHTELFHQKAASYRKRWPWLLVVREPSSN